MSCSDSLPLASTEDCGGEDHVLLYYVVRSLDISRCNLPGNGSFSVETPGFDELKC